MAIRKVALHDVSAVLGLFAGELDAVNCPACAVSNCVQPSIVVTSSLSREVDYLDRGSGEINISANDVAQPYSLQRVADIALLKSRTAARIKQTAATLSQHISGIRLSDAEFLHSWRDHQGEAFAALLLGASGYVPNFGLKAINSNGEILTTEQVVGRVIDANLDLLAIALRNLLALTTAGVSLSEILYRLVYSSPCLKVAGKKATQHLYPYYEEIDKLPFKPATAIAVYQFEVLYAAVCVASGAPNTRKPRLAQAAFWVYSQLELSEKTKTQYAHIALDEQQIGRLVDFKAATEVLAKSLHSLLNSNIDAKQFSELIDVFFGAANRLGHGDIASKLLNDGLAIHTTEDGPNPAVPPLIAISLEKGNPINRPLLKLLAGPGWSDDPVKIETLAKFLLDRSSNLIERADILRWFGERMKLLQQPGRALALIGSEEMDWELALDDHRKRALWTERSNALRLSRQPAKALNLARKVLANALADKNTEPGDLAILWMNVGILLRETDRVDEALLALETALKQKKQSRNSATLAALAVTLGRSGRFAEAAQRMREAREHLQGFSEINRETTLLLGEIAMRFNARDKAGAWPMLDQIPPSNELTGESLCVFSTLMCSNSLPPAWRAKARELSPELRQRLITVADQAKANGNRLLAANALMSAALLAQHHKHGDDSSLWQACADSLTEIGADPGLLVSIEMARIAA